MDEKKETIKCLICAKEMYRITNTHLWKEHQITTEEYKEKFPNTPMDAPGLSLRRLDSVRGKTYEEIYGGEKAEELRTSRSEFAINQMKDPSQIQARSEKCGYECTDEQKLVQREKHPPKYGSVNYYRDVAFKTYGMECSRCGFSSEDGKGLVVHHRDLVNIDTELGDHSPENLQVFCKKCHSRLHVALQQTVSGFTGISSIEKGFHYILKGLRDELGLDLTDVNFKDTPKRVARAYREIFGGVKDTKQQIEEILETAFPSEGYDSLTFCPDILTFSMCPHHFLPVEYTTAIGYIPSKSGLVLGASKLGRLVELLSQRPVLQETLTNDIVKSLQIINPIGVAVVISGIHYCMRMRGIKKISSFETSAMSGVFMDQPMARKEFFDLLLLARNRGR